MTCNISSTPDFKNNLKALCKRYKSMKQDISDFFWTNWNKILFKEANWEMDCAKFVWLSLPKEKVKVVARELSLLQLSFLWTKRMSHY